MRVLFIANLDARRRYRFLFEPLREVGADVDVFDGSGTMPMVLLRALRRLRAAPRADVLILTGGDMRNFAWYLLARMLTRCKIVLRFGGDPLAVRDSVERGFRERGNWLNLLRSYGGKTLTQFMLRRVDGLVVVSAHLLRSMQAALGQGVRTLVLPPTINPPAPAAADADDRSGADAGLRLLTVTNLNYREKAEGVILIAAALDRLLGRQAIPAGIRYDVVGGGYQLDFLRRAIGANPAVRLHGRSNDVAAFYRSADIFVYCSTLDGYPLVLCEAQSFGLPIAANRWGAFPDMLNQDQDALFFDADDPAELERVLERLIVDDALRSRLGRGALVNFENNNSSARCGQRLQQFLLELAG